MDSGRKKAAVRWVDLPADLLGIISGSLGNPSEIVRFRSVCRSWRSSSPLPPNKLSPFFPLKFPFFDEPSRDVTACAIYLVRPRSDPSKAWIVSIHEAAAGELVMRHALSSHKINGHLEADWIVATQIPIARFYAHNNETCVRCNGDFSSRNRKLVFVSKAGFSQLVGLCTCPQLETCAFRLDLGGGSSNVLRCSLCNLIILDYVKFNGQIFAVDMAGYIYLLDCTTLQPVQMTEKPVSEEELSWFQFVVSDGDLYVVWRTFTYMNLPPCEIYRLKVVPGVSGILVEQVQDLGDRVFFITHKCSFSVSARLLPHPWRQGNCILMADDYRWLSCQCAASHRVFHLGSQTITKLCPPEGDPYSDLFCPPTSLVAEELDDWKQTRNQSSSSRRSN